MRPQIRKALQRIGAPFIYRGVFLQTEALQQVLIMWVGPQRVPLRIHFQPFQSRIALSEGGLQPLERLTFVTQGAINLSKFGRSYEP
jgi:hypothetical protein